MKVYSSMLQSAIYSLCLAMVVAYWAKPGCPETCGYATISYPSTIPYPFGIGPECSANSWFTVICRNSKPFLSSLNLEAIDFSLDARNHHTVSVVLPATPLNCSSRELRRPLGISLVGSPFTYSPLYNKLVVMGCQNEVFVLPNSTATSALGGCLSVCGEAPDSSCMGINCCQTSIPGGLQEPQVRYRTSETTSNDSFCGYAFLAGDEWFANHNLGPEIFGDQLPIVMLGWSFDMPKSTLEANNCQIGSDELADSSPQHAPCNCIGRFQENSSHNVLCTCRYDHVGNPYIPGGSGCQLAQCENSYSGGYCPGEASCHLNIAMGYYTCVDLDHRSKKKTAYISVGSTTGALLLLITAWMSFKLIRKRIEANRKKKFFKRNGGLLLQQQMSSLTDKGVEKTKLFNSKELGQATDHYNENRILGCGGQGTVYKGMLTDGRIVAVKKSKKVDEADLQVFINEVVILSQINHRNVVKLLGCCLETEVPLLVYEFIPNGTLFQHIHSPTEEFQLSWKMRVRIATEIAGALSYLHSAASAPIYHRDIKSTNILLDDKYRAKVSDFGTSRTIAIDQTHLTTRVMGTFGYFDPEYFRSGQFTEKSDVYSFGVVMVELLTGEKAVSSITPEEGMSLATHFLHAMEEDRLFDILDPGIVEEGLWDKIMAMAKLARRCLRLNGKRRPTMKEVAMELEDIQMVKQGSVLQSNHESTEFYLIESSDFHSSELSGDYDCSFISKRTQMDAISADSSDSLPLFIATHHE